MSYHKNSEINQSIIRLLDTLCSWERDTSRGSKLLLINNYEDDGEILFAMDGKPISHYPTLLLFQLERIKEKIGYPRCPKCGKETILRYWKSDKGITYYECSLCGNIKE